MSNWTDGAWWRAAGTAALLFLAGGVMGILVDRLWLDPPPAEATQLTARAMGARLGLSSSEAAHVQDLLDSLQAEIHAVVEQEDPDALRSVIRQAHQRIEAALPPDARPAFRAWTREHREHMMSRMPGGPMDYHLMQGRDSSGAGTEDQHRRPH